MSTETVTAWPAGVIARYLTVGGATVDVTTRSGYYNRTDPTESVATCNGCDKTESVEWVLRAWDYSENGYASVTDEGGERSTPKIRDWAQAHAEKCRAMPKPNQT